MRKQASPLGVKVARYVNAGSLFLYRVSINV